MSKQEQRDAARLAKLQRLQELRRDYSLFFYKPYAKQRDFHAAGARHRERMFFAGNQLGKCNTIASKIDTEYGPLTLQEIFGKGIRVPTWPDNSLRNVSAWVRKPPEECFRITFSDGRWIECPRGHRLLTRFGWLSVGELLPFLQQYGVREQGFLSNVLAGALHLYRKFQGLKDRCSVGFRPHDAQLLQEEDGVQVFLPKQAYVPIHSHASSPKDGLADICTSIFRLVRDRLSSLCVVHRFLGLCEIFSVQDERSIAQSQIRNSRVSFLFRHSAHLVREVPSIVLNRFSVFAASLWSVCRESKNYQPTYVSCQEIRQSLDDFCRLGASPEQFLSWLFPSIKAGNHIIHIGSVGIHPLYDLTVEDRHNYCAGGLVHHNTLCAGNEVTMHLTGLYPEWWQGFRFERQNRWWVSSVTAELTRDGAQRVLLGPIGRWGTGTIPKELILDIKRARGVPDAVETVLVRNTLTGEPSQVTFKAYKDGREAFQAETLDGGWCDEEPPEEIYFEKLTRTNNTGGPMIITFTPLMGMSSVVMRFLGEPHPDRYHCTMTIDDVEHYTPEQKKTIIDSYPEHEREARTKGIPMLGEGRIFPIAEEVLREQPLVQVPSHWKHIIGMDFGWDHPTAAAHLIHDPDADCVHVVRCYRRSREIPVVHVSAIKPWGNVPVAWPKDALMHDKGGSCEQLCSQYRTHGLQMLSEFAQFPDKRGNGVEAGIADMLERMRTGRFKVDVNLSDWWEEFRMYHRKDGQVVKEREDLICATRYGMMMLRYAQPASWQLAQANDRYRNKRSDRTWMSA